MELTLISLFAVLMIKSMKRLPIAKPQKRTGGEIAAMFFFSLADASLINLFYIILLVKVKGLARLEQINVIIQLVASYFLLFANVTDGALA